MRTARLILLCLAILCCACSQEVKGGEPTAWREIARFEGESQAWTPTVNVESDMFRVSWETRAGPDGKTGLVVEARGSGSSYKATPVPVIAAGGPEKGAEIVRMRGKVIFVVRANQPWTIWVEVPE